MTWLSGGCRTDHPHFIVPSGDGPLWITDDDPLGPEWWARLPGEPAHWLPWPSGRRAEAWCGHILTLTRAAWTTLPAGGPLCAPCLTAWEAQR